MKWDEVPDRRVGLGIGLLSGVIGMAVMRHYTQHIEPPVLTALFGEEPRTIETSLGDVIHTHALNSIALLGTHYQPEETASAATARLIYMQLNGTEPSSQMKAHLADWVQWVCGMVLGGAYGGTRTTTAPRDLAGGFFYGIRLWLGDGFLLPLFGLRPGPTALSLRYHLKRLLRFWVYSFVTTALTRLIYALLE